MKKSKVMRRALVGALALAACAALAGCASPAQEGSQEAGSAEPAADGAAVVRIGTMPTEDILPLWVAEQENQPSPPVTSTWP